MILKFTEFINELSNSVEHWIVTQDEDGEDSMKVKFNFVKGDKLTVTSGINDVINHKGRNYHIPVDTLKYFAKKIEN
jgi:hypothetical protein